MRLIAEAGNWQRTGNYQQTGNWQRTGNCQDTGNYQRTLNPGPFFWAPEAIFWYIENIGSRRKSDNSPAIIYHYELFIFHNYYK